MTAAHGSGRTRLQELTAVPSNDRTHCHAALRTATLDRHCRSERSTPTAGRLEDGSALGEGLPPGFSSINWRGSLPVQAGPGGHAQCRVMPGMHAIRSVRSFHRMWVTPRLSPSHAAVAATMASGIPRSSGWEV